MTAVLATPSTRTAGAVTVADPRARPAVRRGPWRSLAVAAAVVAFVVVSSGCTPQQVAESSVSKYFGSKYSACADKIVARESGYNATALSPDGKNIGLFQINAVHTAWVKSTYGYTFASLTDPDKNAQVAKGLSDAALSYYGDRWQPWRLDGKAKTDGSCAA